jgi:hypothetical protein
MTPGLLESIAQLAVTIAVPATIVSILAVWCANRRAPRGFIYAVLLLASVAGPAIVATLRWLNPYSGDPLSWTDLPGAIISWAPAILLPSAFVWGCVKGSTSRGWVPALTTLGVVVAMPIGFLLGALFP